jgi:salicylate hydroxylase
MKVIIVGGGIGGLAAALACANSGHDVQVLERQDKFTEIGAGIQLAPNAFNALDSLGVGEAVKNLAVPVDELRLMDGVTGGVINRLPLDDEYQEVFKNPYMVVHRTDLYYPLLDACEAHPSIKLRTSCAISNYYQNDVTASVTLSNTETVSGDVIVGADGIRSVVRQQLIGDGEPRVSGHTIYRAIVPMDNVPEDLRWNAVSLWSGPKWHFVHYPIASGKYMNLAATIDNQATQAVTGEATPSNTVLELFSELNDEAQRLLNLGRDWKKWVLCDRNSVDTWTDGRVALLGDAAHPMLQYAAQGACMALEDAVVLGELFKGANSGNVSARLKEYNALRKDRTARVVDAARFMGQNIYHAAGTAAQQRNEQLMNMKPSDCHEVLAWLHGVDAPFMEDTSLIKVDKIA